MAMKGAHNLSRWCPGNMLRASGRNTVLLNVVLLLLVIAERAGFEPA
jgi:hypothetical protein